MHSDVLRLVAGILLAGELTAQPADATGLDADVRVCSSEARVDLVAKPLPLGCEILGCCPGCTAGRLEIVLDFSAPPRSEAHIAIEGVSVSRVKALQSSGNIEWRDTEFVLRPGQSRLMGWPSDATDVPFLAPRILLSGPAVLGEDIGAPGGSEALAEVTAQLSITQLLGGVLVRGYAARYTARRCPMTLSTSDSIRFENNIANDSVIALFDARRSTGWTLNEIGRGDSNADVGNVLSSQDHDAKLAIFSDGNAVAFQSNVTDWSDEVGDIAAVHLSPLIYENVTFWIIHDVVEAQKRMNQDLLRANQLFDHMNGGIGFNVSGVHTAETDANDLLDAGCTGASKLHSRVGFVAGQTNVYYNRDPGPRAVRCNDDTIIVGISADGESLAHEFGHAFTLDHTNSVPHIPLSNLMHSGRFGRDMITVGQLFRTSIDVGSVINVHGLRPEAETLDCSTSSICPDLGLDVTPR